MSSFKNVYGIYQLCTVCCEQTVHCWGIEIIDTKNIYLSRIISYHIIAQHIASPSEC